MGIDFGVSGWEFKLWFKITDTDSPICQHIAVGESKAIPFFSKKVIVHTESHNDVDIAPLIAQTQGLLDFDPDQD